MNNRALKFWKDERGIGTLEMIMIVAVIVVIAFAFRKWIFSWVDDLFQSTNTEMEQFNNENTINLPGDTNNS
jgi:Flp pilus assembly pilin Flp